MRLLAALFAISVSATLAGADLRTTAAQFVDHCVPCHTIGGGDGAGPDLLPATKKTTPQLRIAVKAMESNVGPLTPEQVDAFVALLQSPVAQQLVTGGAVAPPASAPPLPPPGSAQTGRRLFEGGKRLANGGSPCFACHTVSGRGGNLAADLTGVHERLGDRGLALVTERPPFPLMKAAYAKHPVTPEEAVDLTAYLRTLPPAASSPAEEASVLPAAAGGALVSMLGAVLLLFRARREGVRSRMVRRASGDRS